jgi:magnesium-transporting ATPase (P-type)
VKSKDGVSIRKSLTSTRHSRQSIGHIRLSEEVRKQKAAVDEDGRSVLQAKLKTLALNIGYGGGCNKLMIVQDKITMQFGVLGLAVAVLSVLVLFIRFFVETYYVKEEVFQVRHLKAWIRFIVTGITILVVAVPEGLPLAVTLSLAYSVKVNTKYVKTIN